MPSLIDKPELMKKTQNFHDYVRKNDGQIGTKQRGIDLNFNNACNLTCKYCFTNSPVGDHNSETLDIDMVRSIADQADELGISNLIFKVVNYYYDQIYCLKSLRLYSLKDFICI